MLVSGILKIKYKEFLRCRDDIFDISILERSIAGIFCNLVNIENVLNQTKYG